MPANRRGPTIGAVGRLALPTSRCRVSDDNELSWRDIIKVGLIVAVLSFLLLFFGGLALKTYDELRYQGPGEPLDLAWLVGLVFFSVGGAVAIGTITIAWRWMHRRPSQPQWGMAFVLLAIVLFGILVWPTPWKYREFGCKVYQLNRFFGGYREVTTLPSCEQTTAAAPVKEPKP